MKPPHPPLRVRRRLALRLTAICIVTSLTSSLVATLSLMLLIVTLALSDASLADLETELHATEPEAAAFFADPARPDGDGLERLLAAKVALPGAPPGLTLRFYYVAFGGFSVMVADARDKVVASVGPDAMKRGTPLRARLLPGEAGLLDAAERGEVRGTHIGRRMVLAGPIRRDGRLVGVALVRSAPLSMWGAMRQTVAEDFPVSGIGIGGVSVFVGCLLGFVTAGSVSRRLAAISRAADSWAAGDLTAAAPEAPYDEFGVLAGRLNAMAADLRQVIELRNTVAVLEERQRITRDLHDTVKQQAFAASLMVASARGSLRAGDAVAAERALEEAAGLTGRMQADLASLFRQLRSTDGGAASDLSERVRRVAEGWDARTTLPVRFASSLQGRRVPDAVAEQAARVAEEAVANAVKHGRGATGVDVSLEADGRGRVRLTVADDGAGFVPGTRRGGGLGLTTMRERAALLPGGSLDVASAPGAGTRVTLCFDAPDDGAQAEGK
jgi:signal transduction histidine kinase